MWPEIEAKLAEPPARDRRPVHPHLLTSAKQGLVRRGAIIETAPTPTRGGHAIVTYQRVPMRDSRAIDAAAARKRLLHARYLGWATATKRHPRGLIGPAGERALHASLVAPEVAGLYGVISGAGSEVTHLYGEPVPGGPLDGAAVHLGSRGGVLVGAVTLLFEVKNIRHWIYPSSHEVYQLLHKAAVLQVEHRTERILPVLVCRRRHYWTRQMAIDLGFFVIEVHEQRVQPVAELDLEAFHEVREELGFSTLSMEVGPLPRLVQSLRDAVPPYAVATAARWGTMAPSLVDHFARLRDQYLTHRVRERAFRDLRAAARAIPGAVADW